MKSATLVCWPANDLGELRSVSNVSVLPMIEMAKRVRDTGLLNGEVIQYGHVVQSTRPGHFMRFRAKAPALPSDAEGRRRKSK